MDRDGFDALILEHLPAAYRLAIRLTGRTDSAEELVQEAMLKAARSWQGFRGQSRFTTWLFAIVINLFRDSLRRKGGSDSVEGDWPDAKAVDPQLTARGAELNELVASHVSRLPHRQREVLVLVAFETMSISQTAELLEISEQNVRTNLHLARQSLKRSLAGYLGEGRIEKRESLE